jgi:hypothetical protein
MKHRAIILTILAQGFGFALAASAQEAPAEMNHQASPSKA